MADDSEAQFTTADFFTSGTFATLAGSTAAVVILWGVANEISGEDTPAWLALIFAMACSFAAYLQAARGKSAQFRKTPRYVRYALVVLNGCLIFSSAFGIQSSTLSEVAVEQDGSETEQYTLSSWEPLFSFKETRKIRTLHPHH